MVGGYGRPLGPPWWLLFVLEVLNDDSILSNSLYDRAELITGGFGGWIAHDLGIAAIAFKHNIPPCQ